MTEKQYAPTKTEKKVSKPVETQNLKKGLKKSAVKGIPNKELTNGLTEKPVETPETKTEKKTEKKPIIKKPEAVAKGVGLPISTKVAGAICRFIKGKKIENVIEYLEQVKVQKKAIPMKGEIPHRKGKMMSGRYPKKASEEIVKLLKTLLANSNVNGLEEPIISEAMANLASRPFGKFGRVRKKRSNIKIKVKEKKK